MSADDGKVSKDAEGSRASKAAELSEEDRLLKEEVVLLVARVTDASDVAFSALTKFGSLLRTASGGVTSIPKPLKFARAHVAELKQALATMTSERNRKLLCDVLSFISMTVEAKEDVPILHYKLQGSLDDLDLWGHEYLRCLAGDVGKEWNRRGDCGESTEVLEHMAHQLTRYFMAHQDEASACDLILETQALSLLAPHCDEHNYVRVAQYLMAVSQHLPWPEERHVLCETFSLLLRFGAFTSAARIAIKLQLVHELRQLFDECKHEQTRMQMALMCAHARLFPVGLEEEKTLSELVGNHHLSEWYRYVGRELDSTAPRSTSDIIKPHLSEHRVSSDSPLQTLGLVLLSGFANCGFGNDELVENEGVSVMTKCKGVSRVVSAAASIGLLHLWDKTEGIPIVDRYSYSDDLNIRAGSYLAAGMVMCGVSSEFDEALSILSAQLRAPHGDSRLTSILGLGVAYAGTRRDDVTEQLVPLLVDVKEPIEVGAFAAYALAMVFPGSAKPELIEIIFCSLRDHMGDGPLDTVVVYYILALGCICLGTRGAAAEGILHGASALPESVRRFTTTLVTACAYAGTGNVVEVQKLFNMLAEQDEEAASSTDGPEMSDTTGAADSLGGADGSRPERSSPTALNHKVAAAIGVALIAFGEDVGAEMSRRSLVHVLMGDQLKKSRTSLSARAGLPLAYALLSISHPQMSVVEILSKISHDADATTAKAAILALGLVSAGTNNARVATMLRSLSSYYYKERDEQLYLVRVAQGMCAMGKGHVTLSPLFSERFSTSATSLVSILGVVFGLAVDPALLLQRYTYIMLSIVPAIRPRMLLTLNANLAPLKAQVRVGVPVDTVAVPGRPKGITGFQTHNTPVLLGEGDRAELTGSHTATTAVIEGIIIADKKSDAEP